MLAGTLSPIEEEPYNEEDLEKLIAEGDHFLTSGNQLDAQKRYQAALSILSETSGSHSLIVANIYGKMGDSFRDLGNNSAAEKYYKLAIHILKCQKSKDLDICAAKWILEGNRSHISGYLDSAITFYTYALKNITSPSTQATILCKLGDIQRDLKKYNKAKDHYETALSLFTSEFEKASVSRKLGNLDNRYITFTRQQALSEAKTSPKKILIIVTGLPGSGKSTYAKELAKRLSNAVYIEKDTLCSVLLPSEEKYGSSYYNTYVARQSYGISTALADDNLALGKIPILDGYYGTRLTTPQIKKYIQDPTIAVKILYFHCSGPRQWARLEERNEERDTEKIENFDEHRLKHIRDHQVELLQYLNYLVVNTENDFEKNMSFILEYINSPERVCEIASPIDKNKIKPLSLKEAMSGAKEFISLLKTNHSTMSPFHMFAPPPEPVLNIPLPSFKARALHATT